MRYIQLVITIFMYYITKVKYYSYQYIVFDNIQVQKMYSNNLFKVRDMDHLEVEVLWTLIAITLLKCTDDLHRTR